MKYKAKDSYLELDDTANFNALASCSTHLKLKAGLEIEYKGNIPKELKEHLIEVKNKKGAK